ncbi:MAG: hypothetical protein IPN94_02280 [Sphingobacteriales bacterium]|nr:hypothetical protein [Sphingobacteriales bacterium]
MSAYLLRELTKKIAPQVAVAEGGKLKLNLAQCCAWLNLVTPIIRNTSMGELNSPIYLLLLEYMGYHYYKQPHKMAKRRNKDA